MSNQILVLAAGKGTRMHSELPKVLHEAAYHPLLFYVLEAARALEGDVYCVVGHGAEQVEKAFAGQCEFVLQAEQHGTGHAVRMALPSLGEGDGLVTVVCGDTPLLRGESLRSLADFHRAAHNDCTVLTTELADPTGYGRIIRQNGAVTGIVEERDANPEEKQIREINSGVYCFDKGFLRSAIASLRDDNQQGELYLTDTVGWGCQQGARIGGFPLADSAEILGVNDRVQLAAATELLFARKNEELMRSGVTIMAPSTTFIDPIARIGVDTVVEPHTVVRGDVVIGPSCRIGPFAYIRPGTRVAAGAKIGDFVEVKNSTVGQGTKLPHFIYAGDSDIGAGSNVGCGTITCNYNGVKKFRTTIGDHAFIGSNATLVAPVTVGNEGFVAAGSVITQDVPDGALGVGRERQRNIEGWSKKFFETQK